MSFENLKSGCRPCYLMGKATHAPTPARAGEWSRVVVDPRHAEQLHAREPGDLGDVRRNRGGPAGEGFGRTARMYVSEESHDAVVPMKPPNKEAQASAEAVEGRASIKENTQRPRTCPTQCGLSRVPEAARCAVSGFSPTAIIQDKSRMR